MADSPEASESLVKKEADVPANDPLVSHSTSGIMLVCALLLTGSLVWALWDEAFGQRPWKNIQQEFVSRYTRYLKSIKTQAGKTEAEVKESAEYQTLDAEAKAAQEKVKPETTEIDRKVVQIQKQLDAVTDPFQNQRGRLTVINYDVETAKDSAAKKKYRKKAEQKRLEEVEVELPAPDGSGKIVTQKMNYEQLEKFYNDQRDEKATLLGRKAELLKDPTEIAKKRDDYLRHHMTGLGPAQIDGLIRKMDSFDYSILGHQISANESNIVDRCEVCHAGIREPLEIRPGDLAPDGPGKKPDGLARAFVSHPNRELLQIHNPDRFGCSSCHWGNGRATTSDVKGHGRHKYWLWPLFESENIEAGCQQCHAKDRVTQGAETLNLGRDLFYQRGCVGCHRYEGFDRETDALSGARQGTTQLEDQIVGNDKQIRQDTDTAGQPTTDDTEAQRLLAHAESLRVSNSLLAARIDQLKLQSKYLMQDQKKIGPNLKDIQLKLRKEWVPFWLKDPQAFRPGTKMPTFWRFGVDQDGADQIKAISAYLWQESFTGKAPDQARGDTGHGKELFETRGCLACHSIGESDSQIGGTFAANLQKVGEKANYEYIVRWIHNPRERWAPYCPKEKRDLTAEDYSKNNKPYAFDTELNSRCPNDGAELQVQNMTVMPNFRLADRDARDIASYLFSLSSPPSYPDASFMDDPNLKDKGHALIKQYGCASCHEIKGFEEEQRIGKELTVEGATPIERLDFALLTHDAESGHEPLNLHGEPASSGPPAAHPEKPWYNHKGFFEHKLADPSIYDQGKEKDPKDRLRMPKPYLTPQWRNALTTFLIGSVGAEGSNVPASLFYDPQDQRRQDVQNGWWVVKKYNCMGCHQIQVGQRSVLMEVPVYQTPEGKDLLPPRLTSEGARVDPTWLLRFLHDPSLSDQKAPAAEPAASVPSTAESTAGGNGSPRANGGIVANGTTTQTSGQLKVQPGQDRNGVRPYLKARMPTFNFSPNELQTLVRFFMALSGQQEPYIKEPLQPLTEQEKLVARQMFTSGTPCLKCHITGEATHDEKAIAPNFLLAGERLKRDWTFRWLLDPAQISPGTAMPSGLFRKEGDRWVINLPNPPASANEYHHDHADLLVRYMLLLSPDEQRRLLATSPIKPAASVSAQTQGRMRKKNNENLARKVRKNKRTSTVARTAGRSNTRAPGM